MEEATRALLGRIIQQGWRGFCSGQTGTQIRSDCRALGQLANKGTAFVMGLASKIEAACSPELQETLKALEACLADVEKVINQWAFCGVFKIIICAGIAHSQFADVAQKLHESLSALPSAVLQAGKAKQTEFKELQGQLSKVKFPCLLLLKQQHEQLQNLVLMVKEGQLEGHEAVGILKTILLDLANNEAGIHLVGFDVEMAALKLDLAQLQHDREQGQEVDVGMMQHMHDILDLSTARAPLKDMTNNAIPDFLLCPINQEIMEDPVVLAESGHTYEREAIEVWLNKRSGEIEPLTGKKLQQQPAVLVPNIALRKAVQELRENKQCAGYFRASQEVGQQAGQADMPQTPSHANPSIATIQTPTIASFVAPSVAGATVRRRSVTGRNTPTSITAGTTGGSTLGRTSNGISAGTTVGSTAGAAGGRTASTMAGTTAGSTTGITLGRTRNSITAGSTAGTTAGSTAGSTAGAAGGRTAGTTVGTTAGSTVGAAGGRKAGNTAGTTLGRAASTTSGTMGGTTASTTAGISDGRAAGTPAGITTATSAPAEMSGTVPGFLLETSGTLSGNGTAAARNGSVATEIPVAGRALGSTTRDTAASRSTNATNGTNSTAALRQDAVEGPQLPRVRYVDEVPTERNVTSNGAIIERNITSNGATTERNINSNESTAERNVASNGASIGRNVTSNGSTTGGKTTSSQVLTFPIEAVLSAMSSSNRAAAVEALVQAASRSASTRPSSTNAAPSDVSARNSTPTPRNPSAANSPLVAHALDLSNVLENTRHVTEMRAPNSESRVPNSELRAPNAELSGPNSFRSDVSDASSGSSYSSDGSESGSSDVTQIESSSSQPWQSVDSGQTGLSSSSWPSLPVSAGSPFVVAPGVAAAPAPAPHANYAPRSDRRKPGGTVGSLVAAFHRRDLATVQLLFHKLEGRAVVVREEDWGYPLHWAAAAGSAALLPAILASWKINVNTRHPQTKSTALHEAACRGHLEAAERLLTEGARPGPQDEEGDTPLHLASMCGQASMVKLLLEHRASVHTKNKDDETALHLAAFHGTSEAAKLLLLQNALVDAKDKDAATPLHYACRSWTQLAVAETLLLSGAAVMAKDDDGWLPLHYAANSDSVETVMLLLENGSPLDETVEADQTPLHLCACGSAHVRVMQTLMVDGAEVDARNEAQETPLLLAVGNEDIGAVVELIQSGADVNAKDKFGSSPLHIAAAKNRTDYIEFLVCHGARLNAKNKEGETPLHCAVSGSQHHGHAAKLLLELGAQWQARDKAGRNALDIAASNGMPGIVRLINETRPAARR